MQAHIRRQYELEARRERETEYQMELETEAARREARASEDAYLARSAESLARGESEDAFEQRELAAQAAEYRVTDRVNREICEIFAAAGVATERFYRVAPNSINTTEDRRAA